MGGGGGKSYKAPDPPAPSAPPAADEVAEEEAKAIEDARDDARRAALRARGRQGTILTGALGVPGAPETQRKTLLGL
ncbi:hypothetical protein RVX_R10010 [Nitratidesulfovibrio sp. HK-II]|uniref:hypothetical protein n=1 Tax=Nitratidesulfovibrio sp. HK-II TaxID=2009266 RepID=UPI000E2F411B|nr:hypothetical protein [Nitratidesulfovibrio sp. HK-II]GBO95288.1 hypothetical protein RVX_0329 [Nitratidesulfovibrio sp. HK-II]